MSYQISSQRLRMILMKQGCPPLERPFARSSGIYRRPNTMDMRNFLYPISVLFGALLSLIPFPSRRRHKASTSGEYAVRLDRGFYPPMLWAPSPQHASVLGITSVLSRSAAQSALNTLVMACCDDVLLPQGPDLAER